MPYSSRKTKDTNAALVRSMTVASHRRLASRCSDSDLPAFAAGDYLTYATFCAGRTLSVQASLAVQRSLRISAVARSSLHRYVRYRLSE